MGAMGAGSEAMLDSMIYAIYVGHSIPLHHVTFPHDQGIATLEVIASAMDSAFTAPPRWDGSWCGLE